MTASAALGVLVVWFLILLAVRTYDRARVRKIAKQCNWIEIARLRYIQSLQEANTVNEKQVERQRKGRS
jgi:hypothetical protein